MGSGTYESSNMSDRREMMINWADLVCGGQSEGGSVRTWGCEG